jgi:excisionase family DNA binding protein
MLRIERIADGSNTAKPTVSGNRLLTMCEAAEVLRLSARTVREYARRGEIGRKIIGKRRTLRRADLDAFFENVSRNWDGLPHVGVDAIH